MVNWDLYEKRLSVNGNSYREREINSIKKAILDDFKDIPSYREVHVNDSAYINIQVFNTNYYDIKTIEVEPNKTINIGDILQFDDGKWMCFEIDKTNPICHTGKVHLCAGTFSFYKAGVTPNAVDVPYVVFDNISLTRMGIDNNKYMATPDSRMMIVIRDDSINKHIERGDKFVFYANGETKDIYRVIDLNRMRTPGLFILKLDFYSKNDQEEIASPPSPTPPDTGYEILGADEIKYGQTVTYTAKKYVDKQEIPARFTFSIIATDGVPGIAYTLTITADNQCTIKCNDYVYEITLRATETENENNFIEKQIKLISFL